MSAIRNILYVTGFKRPMNTGVSFEDISGVSLFGAELVASETAADARTLLEVVGTVDLAAEAQARTDADAALAGIIATVDGRITNVGSLLDNRIVALELASSTYVTGTALALNLQSYAPLASPALTGVPTAPTAAPGTNTTQLATTAFVKNAITNLIGGAPGALDTLNELAASLGNDANFAGTVTNSLAGKATLAGANVFTDSNTFLTGYGGLSFYAGPDAAPSARNGITVEQITGSTVITVGYNGVLSESVLKIGAGQVMANGTWDFADTTVVNLPYASLAGGNWIYGTNHFPLSNAFDSLDVTSPSGVAFRATNDGSATLVEIGTDGGAAQVANLIIGAGVVNAMGTWNFNGTVSGIAQSAVTGLTDDLAAIAGVLADKASLASLDLKAPIASPAFTGVPTAPTATAGTNTTQLATTAFVQAALGTGYVTLAGEQTLTGKKYFNGGLEAGSGTYNSFANVAQLGLPNESVINAGGGSIIRGGTELHLGSNGGNWLTMGNGTMTMRGTWDFNLATVTNFGTAKVTGLDTALADKLSKGVQVLTTAEQAQVQTNLKVPGLTAANRLPQSALPFDAEQASKGMQPARTPNLMIFGYQYPTDGGGNLNTMYLTATAAAREIGTVFVANPSTDGVGDFANSPMTPTSANGLVHWGVWSFGLTELAKAGVRVLVYVPTGYGFDPTDPLKPGWVQGRTVAQVKGYIDRVREYYGQWASGIFLDEFSNKDNGAGAADPTMLARYQEIYTYCKTKGFELVVANHGTSAPEGYLSVCDVTMLHENSTSITGTPRYDYVDKYSSGRFGAITFGVPTAAAMRAEINSMLALNVGYVWVTDDVLPNPYDGTPTYVADMIRYCRLWPNAETRVLSCTTNSTTVPGFVNGSPHTTVALTFDSPSLLAKVTAGDTLYVSTPSTDLPAGFQIVSVRATANGVITLKMVNNTFNDEACGAIPLNIVHVIR